MTAARPGDPPDPFRVDGRRALVTGASRGIGLAIARGLASAGAELVLTSRNAIESLGPSPEFLGRSPLILDADLSHRDEVDRLVEALGPAGVDILVCNAGVAERAPAELHDDAAWDHVLEVDLTAQFRLARRLGTGMLARGSGAILWTASMMTFHGGRNVVSYTAAKSAVGGVVRALANEWADRGVRVNAIAPGYVETELTTGSHNDPVVREQFQRRIPLGRWGAPGDMAGPAVFLCSPASDYITGVVLPVDGGWLVR